MWKDFRFLFDTDDNIWSWFCFQVNLRHTHDFLAAIGSSHSLWTSIRNILRFSKCKKRLSLAKSGSGWGWPSHSFWAGLAFARSLPSWVNDSQLWACVEPCKKSMNLRLIVWGNSMIITATKLLARYCRVSKAAVGRTKDDGRPTHLPSWLHTSWDVPREHVGPTTCCPNHRVSCTAGLRSNASKIFPEWRQRYRLTGLTSLRNKLSWLLVLIIHGLRP